MYFYATYLSPGRHDFKVFDKGIWYSREIFVVNRNNIGFPAFKKMVKREEVHVNISIMHNYELDNDKNLKTMFDFDEQWWKVKRLVGKDKVDYQRCVEITIKNIKVLKDIFIYTAAAENWPYINMV